MYYCAHAIFYFKLMDAGQETFLVHENVYLISSNDPASACEIAERHALIVEDKNEDGHLELNGKKAAYLFAGIRKIIEVEHHPNEMALNELVLVEQTYSVYETDTLQEVSDLVDGKMVNVLYRE